MADEQTTEETYPEGWKCVVVMVSPDTREVHQVGGDAEAWSRLYGRLYGERAPRGVHGSHSGGAGGA